MGVDVLFLFLVVLGEEFMWCFSIDQTIQRRRTTHTTSDVYTQLYKTNKGAQHVQNTCMCINTLQSEATTIARTAARQSEANDRMRTRGSQQTCNKRKRDGTATESKQGKKITVNYCMTFLRRHDRRHIVARLSPIWRQEHCRTMREAFWSMACINT